MNLKGERIIPASVEKTWVALNDPQTLKACIAGCESIEATAENQYLAVMAVRIGPVNAKFKGRLQLSDIVPLESYKINFDGQGGVAGFGKGSAAVTLSPSGTTGEATTLNYVADAQVGGKIAQIGSRLVESAASKIADDFFKAFEARMTDPAAPAESSSVTHDVASTGASSVAAPIASSGASSSDSASSDSASTGAASTGAASSAGASSSAAPLGSASTGTGLDAPSSASFAASDVPLADPARIPPADPAVVAATAATDAAPMRPVPTLDHVLGGDTEPRSATGGGSTLWWIAGIIIVALLLYFFTR